MERINIYNSTILFPAFKIGVLFLVFGIFCSIYPLYSICASFIFVGLVILTILAKNKATFIVLIFALAPLTGLIKVFLNFKEAPLILDFFLVTTVVYVIFQKFLNPQSLSIKIPFIGFLIAIFFSIALVQIFNPFIPNIQTGVYGFRSSGAFYLISFFAALLTIDSRDDISRVVRTFIITGPIVAVYGIYQFFNPSQAEINYIRQGSEWSGWTVFMKPISTMIGPTHFGMFMVLSALTILTFLLTKRSELKLNKTFLKIAFILILMALLISLSRASYLALIIGAFFILIVVKRKNLKKSIIFLSVFMTIAIIVLLNIIPRSQIIISRISTLTDISDSALNTRFKIWPDRINTIAKNPWGLGIGVTGGAEPIPFKWCDNQFISIGVETGYIGLFIFLWIILLILKKEKNLLKSLKCPFLRTTVCWITVFTVAFLSNMITNQTLLIYPIPMYFWFMIGILYKIKFIEQKNESQ
ncbi:hypothetical protein ES702_03229 [subsurface metagenome]